VLHRQNWSPETELNGRELPSEGGFQVRWPGEIGTLCKSRTCRENVRSVFSASVGQGIDRYSI